MYEEECLFICLFAVHLDRVRASEAKLSRNPPLIQEKVESYFFLENDKSFSPPKTLLGFQKEVKSRKVFEGAESQSGLYLAEILLVSSEPIGIDVSGNSLILMRFARKQS